TRRLAPDRADLLRRRHEARAPLDLQRLPRARGTYPSPGHAHGTARRFRRVHGGATATLGARRRHRAFLLQLAKSPHPLAQLHATADSRLHGPTETGLAKPLAKSPPYARDDGGDRLRPDDDDRL